MGSGSEPQDRGRGVPDGVPFKFCHACGNRLDARAEICPACGVRQSAPAAVRPVLHPGLIAVGSIAIGLLLAILVLGSGWFSKPAAVTAFASASPADGTPGALPASGASTMAATLGPSTAPPPPANPGATPRRTSAPPPQPVVTPKPTVPPAPVVTPVPAGLVAYWRLNEGSGFVATDSAHGHDGILTSPSWISGYSGSALHFTAGRQLSVPNSPAFEPSTVSVDLWVRSSNVVAYANLLAKGYTECVESAYDLYMGGDGSLQWFIRNSAGSLVFTNAGKGVWDGRWHHVAGTYDGSSVKLYVDGVLMSVAASSAPGIKYGLVDTNDVRIGDIGPTNCVGEGRYVGDLDEIRIWNRALTGTEVSQFAHP